MQLRCEAEALELSAQLRKGVVVLSFDQIKELATLVAEKGLGGLEVERSGFRLQVLGRSAAGAPSPQAATAPAAAAPTAASGAASDQEEAAAPVEGHTLTSPIVGTFYVAPSPDSDPYVKVGDRITKGQVVCIVEAMKLMNEIESDVDGEVLQIFPKNAQPVEFGEPLFLVRSDD